MRDGLQALASALEPIWVGKNLIKALTAFTY